MALVNFLQFSSPRCPVEIRDMIWEAAIAAAEPRNLQMRARVEDTANGLEIYPYSLSTPVPPVPALLHTCSRSRQLALKKWKLLHFFFSNSALYSQTIDSNQPGLFFDPKNDTVLTSIDLEAGSTIRMYNNSPKGHLVHITAPSGRQSYIINTNANTTYQTPGYHGPIPARIHQLFPRLVASFVVIAGLYQCRPLWGPLRMCWTWCLRRCGSLGVLRSWV